MWYCCFCFARVRMNQEDSFVMRGVTHEIQKHETGVYSMLLKVVFPSTSDLDTFIGQLQEFGKTETQVVFSTILEKH